VRAIAVTTPTRMPWLPDVPTIAEVVKGSNFDIQTWYAIAGPANLPKPVVERLNAAITKVASEPAMSKRFAELGLTPPSDTKVDAIAPYMKDYQQRVGALVKAAGIKPE
jgi:tripartite-type tricarboxylate transporter receptor subunit TctC